MWKKDLARFPLLVVSHEFLRGKDEPYWLHIDEMNIFGRDVRCKEVFCCRDSLFFLRFGLDMLEECAGSFECLFGISFLMVQKLE